MLIKQQMFCGMLACALLGYQSPLADQAPYRSWRDRLARHDGTAQDSIPLATITTDTGALAPGNTNFARYTVPGECVGAVQVITQAYRRSVADQIAHEFQDRAAARDTLPTNAVTVARVCGTHFTVKGTAETDLPDLFTLALMAQRDSLANSVVEHRMALAQDAGVRAAVLQEAINGYLEAEPVRLVSAEAAAAQLDALGTTVQVLRLNGHVSLLHFARTRFDEMHMQREAERIIALEREIPATTMQQGKEALAVFEAYSALAQIAYVEQPDSVMAIVTRAKGDLERFGLVPSLNADFGTLSLSSIRDALVPFNTDHYEKNSMPPLKAAYWFPKAPDAWPPGDDRPSLIFYSGGIGNACPRGDGEILDQGLSWNCRVLYADIPKWTQQYDGRLAITIVQQIQGTAARSVVLPPSVEADSLRWFFLDHLRLPITLGVVVDSIWQLPAADGREFYRDTTFYGKRYHNTDVVLFYGERGTLKYVGLFDPALLEKLIEQTMAAVKPSNRAGVR